MKQKKIFFITFCFLNVFLMTSCDSKKEIINNDVVATRYISTARDYYEDGLIYQISSGQTRYVKFSSMENVALCNSANCTHSSSLCSANILGPTPIMYNNKAYYFLNNTKIEASSKGYELAIDSNFNEMDLSNSETKEIVSFNDVEVSIGEGYVLSDNMLYFIGNDGNPQKDEYGNMTYSDVGGKDYLCSINLETGKYTNIGLICYVEDKYPLADSTGSSKILGVYEDKIYIGYSFMKEENGEWCLLNFEYDLKSEILQESKLPYASYINDDIYVYCQNNSINAVVGEKTYNIDNIPLQIYTPIFNEKLFLSDFWIDLKDNTKHKLGKYAELPFVAFYDNSYIVFDGTKAIKLTEEELLALDKE